MVAVPERPWRIRPIELNRLNRLIARLVRPGRQSHLRRWQRRPSAVSLSGKSDLGKSGWQLEQVGSSGGQLAVDDAR